MDATFIILALALLGLFGTAGLWGGVAFAAPRRAIDCGTREQGALLPLRNAHFNALHPAPFRKR